MTTTARDAMTEEGKAAIRAERQAAKAAKREVDELRAKVREHEERENVRTLTAKAARLERELNAATLRAEDAEAQLHGHLLRVRVAVDKKLSVALLDRLSGTTEAELAADADALLSARHA